MGRYHLCPVFGSGYGGSVQIYGGTKLLLAAFMPTFSSSTFVQSNFPTCKCSDLLYYVYFGNCQSNCTFKDAEEQFDYLNFLVVMFFCYVVIF